MKHGTLPLAGIAVFALAFSSSAIRVYWIGNSVTDALKYGIWKETAVAAGQEVTWGRTMIPGAPISWLWGHPGNGFSENPFGTWDRALKDYEWDVVSLQPYDRGLDEYPDSDVPMSVAFINYTKGKSPDVQFVLFAHYPRQDYINASGGYQEHWVKPYQNTNGGQETRQFYELVVEGVRARATDVKPILLVPVGDVYYELDIKMRAGQFPGKGDIVSAAYADGIHQNDFGNYIVGCTYYAVMFKTNPSVFSGSRYGVSDQEAAIIQQTVWDVVTANEWSGVNDNTRAREPAMACHMERRPRTGQPQRYGLHGRLIRQNSVPAATGVCITFTKETGGMWREARISRQ